VLRATWTAPRTRASRLPPAERPRAAPAATPTQTPLSPLTVTFSHKRNKKLQQPNLQWKRIYWPEEQRWVRLRVCARALKTVEKNGLAAVAKEHGVDLRALPYVDARPARVDWLAAQDVVPPQSKKVVGSSRKMKNEAKLAASAKAPLVARYVLGGPRVMLTRDPALVADVKVRGAVAP
jgi:large subunit ribosomal protein L28